jgi:hypothetical protein
MQSPFYDLSLQPPLPLADRHTRPRNDRHLGPPSLAQVALLSLLDFMNRTSESLVGLSEPVVEDKVVPPN